jgi:DNA-binding transcriptional MerR regulator
MREGLLPGPAKRPRPNVAFYDARLAARIRAIKELQRTRFLPLSVIGELLEPSPSDQIRVDLDEIQRRQLGALTPAAHAAATAGHSRRTGHRQARRTRASVQDKLRVTAEDLDALEAMGLLRPKPDNRGEATYTGSDLELLDIIHEARERGLGDLFDLGIVAPYVHALNRLVQFEIDLFRRRVLCAAQLPEMSLDEIARRATLLGGQLVSVLRDKLVVRELEQIGGAPAADTPSESD